MLEDNNPEEVLVKHEDTLQEMRFGLTVGSRYVYFVFQARKGDIGSEHLTRNELGDVIEKLIEMHGQLKEPIDGQPCKS